MTNWHFSSLFSSPLVSGKRPTMPAMSCIVVDTRLRSASMSYSTTQTEKCCIITVLPPMFVLTGSKPLHRGIKPNATLFPSLKSIVLAIASNMTGNSWTERHINPCQATVSQCTHTLHNDLYNSMKFTELEYLNNDTLITGHRQDQFTSFHEFCS